MAKLALQNARIIDPEAGAMHGGTLLLDGERIEACVAAGLPLGDEWQRVDLEGHFVSPGFIDLHFHGELVTATAGDLPAVLDRTAKALLRDGTTGFLATSLAWHHETLAPFVDAVVGAIEAAPDGVGASCLGLHLEGPWISRAAPGAMSSECIRPYDAKTDEALLDRAGACLRMVTLAPEAEGADALLSALAGRDVLAALGHTRASEAEIDHAVDQGLRHVTHLFNAMGPLHHRDPGVPGTVLAHEGLHCDLICDGHHVHPNVVKLAARTLQERLVLISDRVDVPALAGAPGEPLRLPDGTLAGSQLTMDGALRNVQRFAGVDVTEAVAACTIRPARLLGIEAQRGTLRRSARADLAVLDDEGRVVETWLGGEVACRATD